MAAVLTTERCEQLLERGYIIVDNALDPDETAMLAKAMNVLDSMGSLKQTPEAAIGVRDDVRMLFNPRRLLTMLDDSILRPTGHTLELREGGHGASEQSDHAPEGCCCGAEPLRREASRGGQLRARRARNGGGAADRSPHRHVGFICRRRSLSHSLGQLMRRGWQPAQLARAHSDRVRQPGLGRRRRRRRKQLRYNHTRAYLLTTRVHTTSSLAIAWLTCSHVYQLVHRRVPIRRSAIPQARCASGLTPRKWTRSASAQQIRESSNCARFVLRAFQPADLSCGTLPMQQLVARFSFGSCFTILGHSVAPQLNGDTSLPRVSSSTCCLLQVGWYYSSPICSTRCVPRREPAGRLRCGSTDPWRSRLRALTPTERSVCSSSCRRT